MKDATDICEDGAGEYAPDEIVIQTGESQLKVTDALNQLSVSSADSLNSKLKTKTENSIHKSVKFKDHTL